MAGNFLRRLKIGLQCCLLDIGTLSRTCRVDINGHKRLCRVDYDRSARGQAHFALEGCFDLAFYLKTVKKRYGIFIFFDALAKARHHHRDEVVRLFKGAIIINEHLINIIAKVVPDSAYYNVTFLV